MTILLIVLIIIAIPFVAALFMKKNYTIEREVIINKPKQQVFDYVKFVKNQDYYSKWQMMDPTAEKTYSGTDGTVGFSSAWKSNNKQVGQGVQTITSIIDGKRLDVAVHFIKPFEGNAGSYITTTEASQNQTNIKWGINGRMKYPMNIMMAFMNMEKMIGNDLQTNLDNLKKLLEK